jgi:vacuolar-type H+-ATPase subunit I/STV1
MSRDIRRDVEDLVRYYGELVARLPRHGVRDVAELLSLYEQLRRAMDAVSRQEIGWAAEQTQRLVDALVQMDSNLQALRRLKAALERVADTGVGRSTPRRIGS